MDATTAVGWTVVLVIFFVGVYFYNQHSTAVAARNRLRQQEQASRLQVIRQSSLDVIARGEIPHDVATLNVLMLPGERAICALDAKLYEERVLSRKWESGSKGISIPTGVLGTKISIGKTNGQVNVERGSVPISTGKFIVTTRHIIFGGDAKSTKTPLVKLINVNCADNGAMIGITGRQKPLMVMFDDPLGGQLVRAALQLAYALPDDAVKTRRS